MAYIVINDFRFGLDKRRLDLANRPGALADLVNAHITNGGEIEKRKAFTRTSLVNTSFGLEAVKDSLVVFGSAADPGGWPTGVTYQRLQHPQSLVATLTSVIHSTVYGGKVFAIAEFSDGSRWMYYDGTILDDNRYGIVHGVLTVNVNLAAEIAAVINATSDGLYTAVQQAFPNNHKVDVYGPVGTSYSVAISKVSALGTLTSAIVDGGVPGVVGTSAIGSFQIVSGTEVAGNQITQVAVGVTNLLTAAIPYNDSPERTASDVAVGINANSGVSGYSAAASGRTVLISAVATGTAANNLDITVTSAVDVCIGLCRFNLVGTGFTLDYVNVDGVNIMTAVLIYPTPPGETITAFCARVKANINANTGVSGYLSDAISNSIFLSKAVTKGTDVIKTVSVSVTPAGGTGAVYIGDVTPFLVSIAPSQLLASPGTSIGREEFYAYFTTISSAIVTPVGGVPPYTYQWIVQLFASSWGILSPNSPSTSFRALLPVTSHGSTTAVCEVRDSSGLLAVSPQVTISW